MKDDSFWDIDSKKAFEAFDVHFKRGVPKQPLPPASGVPPQKMPRWLRFVLQSIIIPFLWIDEFVHLVAHKLVPPPFKKVGKCSQTGRCCHTILLEWSPWYDRFGGVWGKVVLWWQTELNGFYLRPFEWQEGLDRYSKIFGCRYLESSGKCGRYFFRPLICRRWPRIEIFGRPQRLKGCGFKAHPKTKEAYLWLERNSQDSLDHSS